MKAARLICLLLVLLAVAVRLPAQQSEADSKLFEEIKAKAETGDAQSQYELGAAFFFGNFGVAKDEVEALKWWRKAADQNHATAQYDLGLCYANGQGVAKDDVEAMKWYRKAAEQNNAPAQYSLGVCYAKGEGVPKDDVESVKWYHKAAEQNLAQAQYNLGLCYVKGQGVAKDYVEGYKWWLLATAQGDEVAKKGVTVLEDSMTREQIAEGQKRARYFKPREVPAAGGDS